MHRAVHLRTNTVVAIKIVPIENDLEDIVREVTVMNGLDSTYIVHLFGSYLKDANLWVRGEHAHTHRALSAPPRPAPPRAAPMLSAAARRAHSAQMVMEYCAAGSVSDIIKTCKITLTEAQIATICKDALLGLQYLHERRKIHRDIKAGNILLTAAGESKLGTARTTQWARRMQRSAWVGRRRLKRWV